MSRLLLVFTRQYLGGILLTSSWAEDINIKCRHKEMKYLPVVWDTARAATPILTLVYGEFWRNK